MGAPQQPLGGVTMWLAMSFPQEYRWLFLQFYGKLENNVGYILMFFAFWAFCRFLSWRFPDEFVEGQCGQDTPRGEHAQNGTEDDRKDGAEDGRNFPTCEHIENLLVEIVQSTSHPVRQSIDERIEQGIIAGFNSTAKADLITVKDGLAAVRNQSAASKEVVVTNYIVVAPPQDQPDKIGDEARRQLLFELRNTIARDFQSEARRFALQAHHDFDGDLNNTNNRLHEQIGIIIKDLSKFAPPQGCATTSTPEPHAWDAVSDPAEREYQQKEIEWAAPESTERQHTLDGINMDGLSPLGEAFDNFLAEAAEERPESDEDGDLEVI
ncbi:hypothetical protein E8E12_008492 [Didymella heteroderae]|uniref:Uncharacterized protein n=1 Tax=Didymella heteroderae TaxID=1769908 RepID=A0A9P5BZU2_9PLEO|nr:hypothetical protein E8E12_008492 [Didymella heteroderae]